MSERTAYVLSESSFFLMESIDKLSFDVKEDCLYSVEIHALCMARTHNGDYPTNGLSMFLIDGKCPGLRCNYLKILAKLLRPLKNAGRMDGWENIQ
jgi:hypothetical protein